MDGWIKLHRKITENWLWEEKPFSKGQAWVDLLLMANHKDNKFMMGEEVVTIKKGSFVTSELKLMERWGWGKSKTRTFLKALENDGMIVKNTNKKRTTISLCNYCDYSECRTDNRPIIDQSQTDSRPIADTNKNVKNEKKEKNRENPFLFL